MFDLAGWQLTLDHGTVFIPALGMTAFDFSTEPLSLALSTALSTLSLSGPNEFWDIPLSAVVTFWTLGNTVTVTVSGSLLLGVPEPSTLVLLGAGLGGLVMTRRRPGWGKRPAP